MDFTHTEDRRMLAETLQRFVGEQASAVSRIGLAAAAPGYDPELWSQFAELGVVGALFTPEQGGFAGRGFDIMVVFEAIGRGLVSEPLLSSLMAGQALAAAGGQGGHVEALVAGAEVIAFAHQEADAGYDLGHVATRAQRDGEGWVLDGAKTVVRDAEGSSSLLVSARTSGAEDDADGVSLFLVPTETAGVSLLGYACVDRGRAAEVRLDKVALPGSALVGQVGQGAALLDRAVQAGILALCAEAVGAMDLLREMTVEYLRTRSQFGAPIGRNQALQHRMASLYIEIEQARSAVINAAAAIDGPAEDRERVLSAAKYTIGRTGTLVAEEAVQMHGGIGMTWELPLGHVAKRLMMINHQLGDDDHHLARYVALGRTG
jgi:alkylation response protein AidB-like acyl-CoA dehydrogenase